MDKIGSILRESEWSATITLAQFGEVWETIDIEPGDSLQKHFGVAVDLGTTTVVGYLIDLGSGVVLQTTADYNGQVEFGEDILTRIYNATTTEGGAKLQKAATNTINGIISRLTSLQNINTTDVSALSIGANTTMVHLLLGLDPSRICMAPYIPVVNYPGSIRASEIGLKMLSNLFGSVGLERVPTDDPEILEHIANVLMARIGSRVSEEDIAKFNELKFCGGSIFR